MAQIHPTKATYTDEQQQQRQRKKLNGKIMTSIQV